MQRHWSDWLSLSKLVGHTDLVGSESHNLDLSQRRADSVRVTLIERGVGGSISAVGYGESQPVLHVFFAQRCWVNNRVLSILP